MGPNIDTAVIEAAEIHATEARTNDAYEAPANNAAQINRAPS